MGEQSGRSWLEDRRRLLLNLIHAHVASASAGPLRPHPGSVVLGWERGCVSKLAGDAASPETDGLQTTLNNDTLKFGT